MTQNRMILFLAFLIVISVGKNVAAMSSSDGSMSSAVTNEQANVCPVCHKPSSDEAGGNLGADFFACPNGGNHGKLIHHWCHLNWCHLNGRVDIIIRCPICKASRTDGEYVGEEYAEYSDVVKDYDEFEKFFSFLQQRNGRRRCQADDALLLIRNGQRAGGVAELERLAALNYPPANDYLARVYSTGEDGFPLNEQRAFEYATRGESLVRSTSRDILARFYWKGVEGVVERDSKKAVALWRKLADSGGGCGWYQHCLGVCYFRGDGVEKDLERAKDWFLRARARGFTQAEDALRKIEEIQKGAGAQAAPSAQAAKAD